MKTKSRLKRKMPIKHMVYYRVVRPRTCDDIIVLAENAYKACEQLGWNMKECDITFYEKHHNKLLNKLFRAYEKGPIKEK
jgi:hypothetical protein